MPALLRSDSMMMCPHGGTVQVTSSNTRARIGGLFALRASDTFLVAGCPFTIGPTPHPCVQVNWVQPASRGQAVGDFMLTEDSVGLCAAADQAVQGTVMITMAQSQGSGL